MRASYIGHTEEGDEEGGDDDEEREELSVFVEKLELVHQACNHRLHTTHLQRKHAHT